MKQYVIDDIRPLEMARLKTWCAANLAPACFDNVFWLVLADAVLTPLQTAHAACRPHYLSLTLEAERAEIDLAVRTKRTLHCECMGYVTPAQFAWLDAWVDATFAGLRIKT